MFGIIMFWVIVLESIVCLIIWKTKIDPDGGTVWAYLYWVLLCVLIAASIFEPWVAAG